MDFSVAQVNSLFSDQMLAILHPGLYPCTDFILFIFLSHDSIRSISMKSFLKGRDSCSHFGE